MFRRSLRRRSELVNQPPMLIANPMVAAATQPATHFLAVFPPLINNSYAAYRPVRLPGCLLLSQDGGRRLADNGKRLKTRWKIENQQVVVSKCHRIGTYHSSSLVYVSIGGR